VSKGGLLQVGLEPCWIVLSNTSRGSILILKRTEKISTNDPARYAWAGLRRFHDVGYVQKLLVQLHSLPKKELQNAKKQATQIRQCLIQAREYFDAAQTVTLATKPVLLYYSTMCLALAEILLKQTGTSSLDYARAQHRHHGLEFHYREGLKSEESLAHACSRLRAAPIIRNGGPYGTFALWHHSARESPAVGKQIIVGNPVGYSRESWGVMLEPRDDPPDRLLAGGLNLYDCLLCLPHMRQFMATFGAPFRTLRTRVEQRINEGNGEIETRITIHPIPEPVLTEFLDNIMVNPGHGSYVDYNELPIGGQIVVHDVVGQPATNISMPHCTVWNSSEVVFWVRNQPLNEFGFFYVALFIVSNLARYYPDIWLREIERSTPIVLAVEELLRGAEERNILFPLSEMRRALIVLD
jgi:hypothetical protein